MLLIHSLVGFSFFPSYQLFGLWRAGKCTKRHWGLWRLLQRFEIPRWLCRVLGKSVRSARSLLLALSLIFTFYSLLGMFQMGKSWEAFLRVSRGNERKALI